MKLILNDSGRNSLCTLARTSCFFSSSPEGNNIRFFNTSLGVLDICGEGSILANIEIPEYKVCCTSPDIYSVCNQYYHDRVVLKKKKSVLLS